MSYSLLIVESPSKARTLQKYLESNYKVAASFGHIMDLPEKEFGVDIDNNFNPDFILTKRGAKTIKEIKSLAENADKIILAADPDREGEAICFHLSSLLSKKGKQFSRIELHEITKNSLYSALKSPGKIKMDLVESQITRRILDRIVGYKLSPILWKKLHNPTLSAGRVQSVILRWICEREREIENFASQEYWRLSVKGKTESGEELILHMEDPEKEIKNILEVQKFWSTLFEKNTFDPNEKFNNINVEKYKKFLTVTNFITNLTKKNPPPPYITASLQKDVAGKLKFSTKKTMSIAQKLYEGVNAGNEFGTTGLITYMRTDSTRMNKDFQNKTNRYISQTFGEKYLGNFKSKKAKIETQDAHEAIRPVVISITPGKLKGILSFDEWNLYNLIWKRAVASLMKPEEGLNQTIETELSGHRFTASGRKTLFEGFTVIYEDWKKANSLPELEIGETLRITDIYSEQKFTEPPPRYTEATLVEKMEKEGIGRPSTYSSSIEVLYKRKYANQKLKALVPTDLGFEVNDFLSEKISYLFENHFTRDVEEDLDKIANGDLARTEFLKSFYAKFLVGLNQIESQKTISKKKKAETEKLCPVCQSRILKRKSPKNKTYFLCSKFPNCEYMEYY